MKEIVAFFPAAQRIPCRRHSVAARNGNSVKHKTKNVSKLNKLGNPGAPGLRLPAASRGNAAQAGLSYFARKRVPRSATGEGKDYVWLPGTYEPLGRVDFTLTDSDNGDVLRNTESGADVHLDWTLDGSSGPFVVKRSTGFSFSNPVLLGPSQSAKTFDDPVLGSGQNYSYRVFRRTLTDALYFYHDDHLGTPIAMTNATGIPVWRAEHTPFGGIYALTVGTVSNNLRFPGQYFDGETGLSQNYYRDYRFTLGRYHEFDPLVTLFISKGQLNRLLLTAEHLQGYTFTGNNPIGGFDFTGLLTKLCHRRLKALPFPIGRMHHDFLWVNGHTFSFNEETGGHVAVDDPFDHSHETDCHKVSCIDEGRLAKNIKDSERHPYSYNFFGFNCQDWAAAMLNLSHKKNCCDDKSKP